jgi:hypothetical protein
MSSRPGAFFGLNLKITARTSFSVISICVCVSRGVSPPSRLSPSGSGYGGKKAWRSAAAFPSSSSTGP